MVFVKFLRNHESFVRGDVAAFEDSVAMSLVRKGIAMVAPDDLRPRLSRQAAIETEMVSPAAEYAVTREVRG